MLKKKLLAGVLTAAMVLSMAACGDKTGDKKDSADSGTKQEETKEEENTVRVESQNKDVEEGYMVTFEDEKMDFVSVNSANGAADNCELSIVDFNGSKALKVTTSGEKSKMPYVAIDCSSLLGDAVANVATIQADIAALDKDGKFNACSGYIYAYVGEELEEKSGAWSVYLEDQNPKLSQLDVTGFVAGASNFVQISKEEDSGAVVSDLYIDNIVFRDADNNPIAVDTAAAFEVAAASSVFSEQKDWSNLVQVTSEKEIQTTVLKLKKKSLGKPDGTATGTDVALVVTGKQDRNDNDDDHDFSFWKFDERYAYITVYYDSEKAPVLIFESEKDDAPVASCEVTASAVNDSNTIAQYTFEDVSAAFGTTDMTSYLDCMKIRADGADLTVEGATIGCVRTMDDSKAVEVNQVLNGSGTYTITLADLGEYTEGKPLKGMIIQFSGILNNGEYMGVIDDDGSFSGLQTSFGISIEGVNESNWYYTEDEPSDYADYDENVLYNQYGHGDGYRGTEEIIYEFPEEVTNGIDYSYDGTMQLGVWWMAGSSATIDKIQFITE